MFGIGLQEIILLGMLAIIPVAVVIIVLVANRKPKPPTE